MRSGAGHRDPALSRKSKEDEKARFSKQVRYENRSHLPSLLAGSPLRRLELEPAHEASPIREVEL
jgi:hypothetical protein